jgi:hypothetical protein
MSKAISQLTAIYNGTTRVPPFIKGHAYRLTIERRHALQGTHVVILRAEGIESVYADYKNEQTFWQEWEEVG